MQTTPSRKATLLFFTPSFNYFSGASGGGGRERVYHQGLHCTGKVHDDVRTQVHKHKKLSKSMLTCKCKHTDTSNCQSLCQYVKASLQIQATVKVSTDVRTGSLTQATDKVCAEVQMLAHRYRLNPACNHMGEVCVYAHVCVHVNACVHACVRVCVNALPRTERLHKQTDSHAVVQGL